MYLARNVQVQGACHTRQPGTPHAIGT